MSSGCESTCGSVESTSQGDNNNNGYNLTMKCMYVGNTTMNSSIALSVPPSGITASQFREAVVQSSLVSASQIQRCEIREDTSVTGSDDVSARRELSSSSSSTATTIVDIIVIVNGAVESEGLLVVSSFEQSVINGTLIVVLSSMLSTLNATNNTIAEFVSTPEIQFEWTETALEFCYVDDTEDDGLWCWEQSIKVVGEDTTSPTSSPTANDIGGDATMSLYLSLSGGTVVLVAALVHWQRHKVNMFAHRVSRTARNVSKRSFGRSSSGSGSHYSMSLKLATDELISACLNTPSHHSSDDLIIDPKRIRLAKKLAAGGGGVVYRGYFGERVVAVKEVTTASMSAEAVAAFQNEALLMRRMNHPLVVRLYGTVFTESALFLVMEVRRYCRVCVYQA
jgi:hypothetical protein